jgi:GNAT superfamily N-acetyltransferase
VVHLLHDTMLASDAPTLTVHTALPSEADIERAADAYLAGFSGPPYFETAASQAEFVERVRRYAARDGFRLVVASEGEAPAGVGLAVIAHPGDWWRDQVAAQLTAAEAKEWLGDSVLEVVNLAVRPESRGRGLGAALHEALLTDAEAPTAVLTADTRATPARTLYETRGWTILRERVSIGGSEPVTLLARRLRGGRRGDPPA